MSNGHGGSSSKYGSQQINGDFVMLQRPTILVKPSATTSAGTNNNQENFYPDEQERSNTVSRSGC